MFTDDQVVPTRLEFLIELLQKNPEGLARDWIYELLQPTSLNGGNHNAATATVSAALELNVATEVKPKKLIVLSKGLEKVSAREAILDAFDKRVLCSTAVEPYFATFYSFLLNNPERSLQAVHSVPDYLEQTFGARRPANVFNETKLRGLFRWFSYVGLGWFDPQDNFQPLPYERLARSLPAIFSSKRKMNSEEWMKKLAANCPELDGGALFMEANRGWQESTRQCSIGLGNALLELEHDGLLKISRPADSAGWSIANVDPPTDYTSDRNGARISFIELVEEKRKRS